MTQPLPSLIVIPPLDHTTSLVLVQAQPGVLGILQVSVLCKPCLDGVQVCPELPGCQTTVTPITNASKVAIHFLVISTKIYMSPEYPPRLFNVCTNLST